MSLQIATQDAPEGYADMHADACKLVCEYTRIDLCRLYSSQNHGPFLGALHMGTAFS